MNQSQLQFYEQTGTEFTECLVNCRFADVCAFSKVKEGSKEAETLKKFGLLKRCEIYLQDY